MTDKDFVKHYYADAYSKDEGDFFIYAKLHAGPRKGTEEIIGEGVTEDNAWEDAKYILENKPEYMRPFSIYFAMQEAETRERISAIDSQNKKKTKK